MAKSAGNFERVTELPARGLDPLALRYLALTVRYGRKLNYSHESLAGAAAALASLRARLAALGPPPADGPWAAPEPLLAAARGRASGRRRPGRRGPAGSGAAAAESSRDRARAPDAPLSPEGRALHDRFVAALDDDLDLPGALACVREVLRSGLPDDERRWLVLDADQVLGLDLHRVWAAPLAEAGEADVPREVRALLAARTKREPPATTSEPTNSATRLRTRLGRRRRPQRLNLASPLKRGLRQAR